MRPDDLHRRFERDQLEEGVSLNARIGIVATIVAGQLWALTTALDAWLGDDMAAVWWLLAFQALSFAVALAIWLASPRD